MHRPTSQLCSQARDNNNDDDHKTHTHKHKHTHTQHATTTTTTSRLACKIARQRGHHILLAESRATSVFTSCLRIPGDIGPRILLARLHVYCPISVSPGSLSSLFGAVPPRGVVRDTVGPTFFACYGPSVVAFTLYCVVLAPKTCTAQLVPN